MIDRIIVLIACLLSGFVMPVAIAEEQPPKFVAEATIEAALIAEIRALRWAPIPESATPLAFSEVIEALPVHHLTPQIALAKIEETQAKQLSVKNKRVLLFFRYFNSQYLEGSAESDVLAAREHYRHTLNQMYEQGARAYLDAMEATLLTHLRFQQIQRADRALVAATQQFKSGDTTSFKVTQAKHNLLATYQTFLSAKSLLTQSSLKLGHLVGNTAATAFFPTQLVWQGGHWAIRPLVLFESPPDTAALAAHIKTRPDLNALAYRRKSVKNLLQANTSKFDRNQQTMLKATIRQMALRWQQVQGGADIARQRALDDRLTALHQLELADAGVQLALRSLTQTDVSYRAGFSSDTDRRDAQLVYDEALTHQHRMQLRQYRAELALLGTAGLTTQSRLLKATPLPSPPPPPDIPESKASDER